MLKSFKKFLFDKFVRKWTKHTTEIGKCIAIVFDGNWKTARAKCCFDGVDYNSCVLGPIPIGCTQTPMRKSYYCEDHQSHQLMFAVGDEFKIVKPNDIRPTILGMYILIIYL